MGLTMGLYAMADADLRDLMPRDRPHSMFSKLAGFLGDRSGEGEFDSERLEDSSASTDLDKGWHGIHYLLTKTAEGGEPPLCFIRRGGVEIPSGEEVRLFFSADVAAIDAALASITEDWLKSRYEPADMQRLKIYPHAIWVRDGNEAFDYLMENFRILRAFMRATAANGSGMIVTIG